VYQLVKDRICRFSRGILCDVQKEKKPLSRFPTKIKQLLLIKKKKD